MEIKVFKGKLIEDSGWVSTCSIPHCFIGTYEFDAPEFDGEKANLTIEIPLSKAFPKFDIEKVKTISISIEY